MKQKLVMLCLSGLVPALSALQAQAYDGTVTFTGNIVAQTCSVTNGGQIDVTLPTVQTKALEDVGSTQGSTPFKINLTGCGTDKGMAKIVGAYFEAGPTWDPVTGKLKNMAAPDKAAKNVQIGLKNIDGTDITIGDSMTIRPVEVTDGTTTLSYLAHYYSLGKATPGPVNSSVTFSLIYQ